MTRFTLHRFKGASIPGSRIRLSAVALGTAGSVCLLMSIGCGLGTLNSGTTRSTVAAVKIDGNVHGGQQPVTGAAVYLLAASSSGYSSASASIINVGTAGVSTDTSGRGYVSSGAGGNFSLTGAYTCPTPGTQVYALAAGGNPGLAAGTNNTASMMMAALGNCGNLSSSTFIQINELTTVAAVWALAPFMADGFDVGSSSTNNAGLVAAFNGAAQMANVSTGTASGPALPANSVLPVAEINTLANVLAACINSTGGLPGDGSACGNLFAGVSVAASSSPIDTIGAALYIARRPSNNVSALFNMASATGPFQPTLSVAPNDWTIAVQYNPIGLSTPKAIALDAGGNVWIANCGSSACATAGLGSVTKLTSAGVLVGTAIAGGLNIPSAIAIDLNGNAWIANAGGNSVTQLSAASMLPVAAAYTGGGLNAPNSIAIDSYGQAWITNAGNGSVTVLSSAGAALTPSGGYSGVSVPSPVGIVINPH